MDEFNENFDAPELPDAESQPQGVSIEHVGGSLKLEIYNFLKRIVEQNWEREPSQKAIYEEIFYNWFPKIQEYEVNFLELIEYVKQYHSKSKNTLKYIKDITTKSEYSLLSLHVKFQNIDVKSAIFIHNDSKETKIYVIRCMPIVDHWKIVDPSVYYNKETKEMVYVAPEGFPEDFVSKILSNTILIAYAYGRVSNMCTLEDLLK